MALIERQYLRTPFYGSRRMAAWLREGARGQSQARTAPDAADGTGGKLSTPAHQSCRAGTSHLPIPATRAQHRAGQPGVDRRPLLPSGGAWLSLPDGGDGLGERLRAGLAAVQSARGKLLRRGPARGAGSRPSRNLQHRPSSQFTDNDFTGLLAGHGFAVSMDGRGRFSDNIFLERLCAVSSTRRSS